MEHLSLDLTVSLDEGTLHLGAQMRDEFLALKMVL